MTRSLNCYWCEHFMCERCTGKRTLDDKGDCLCSQQSHRFAPKKPDYLMEM